MSGAGHLCSGAGMQGISKTPPLPVPSTRKQMEQAPGWADEGPPVLPPQAQRRQNVRNVRGEKINPFYPPFCQSVALSFLGISLVFLSLLCYHLFPHYSDFQPRSCLIILGINSALCIHTLPTRN